MIHATSKKRFYWLVWETPFSCHVTMYRKQNHVHSMRPSHWLFAEELFQQNGEQIIEDRDDTTEEKTHKVRIGVTEVICFTDSATGAAEINRAQFRFPNATVAIS